MSTCLKCISDVRNYFPFCCSGTVVDRQSVHLSSGIFRTNLNPMPASPPVCPPIPAIPNALAFVSVEGLTVNGIDCTEPADLEIRAFVLAFKRLNQLALDALHAKLRVALLPLSPKELGLNGAFFLNTHPSSWMFTNVTVQTMSCVEREDPVHNDGGAAFVLASLTLWGNRSLLLNLKGHPEFIQHELPMRGGSAYMGSLCAVEHQVIHPDRDPAEANLEADVGGTQTPLRVVLILRGSTFRRARGTCFKNGPTPYRAYAAVAPVLASWLTESDLSWPSLADIMTASADADATRRPTSLGGPMC